MIWINIAFLALNLMVLALNIKLYTEVLKDQSAARRSALKEHKHE